MSRNDDISGFQSIIFDYQDRDFLKSMMRNNAVKAIIIGRVVFGFGIALLILNFVRFQNGMMETGAEKALLYRMQFACHLMLFTTLIPVWYIRKNRKDNFSEAYRNSKKALIWIALTTGLSLVPAGIIGIQDRGSIVGFATYIIFVNHFFYFNGPHRLFINLACFLVACTGIFFLKEDPTLRFVYMIEVAGIIIPSFLIANIQMRLQYENYLNNKILKKKNQMMQSVNQNLVVRSLQGQMNPHFIFNTLNSIQHFMISQDQKSSMEYLGKFARLIRLIFNYSSKNYINLEEEIDFLKLYLNLEKLRFENKVSINLHIDRELASRSYEWNIPPLLIQPLIENAFKHGLMHLEKGGELDIEFTAKDHLLTCIIRDNGVGRDQSTQYANRLDPRHQNGTGKTTSALDIVQERLQVFNNMLPPNSNRPNRLSINDLKSTDGKSEGTSVLITLLMKTEAGVEAYNNS